MAHHGGAPGGAPHVALSHDLVDTLVAALVGGHVQTFVETYYLSRRPRVSREDAGDSVPFLAATRDDLAAAEKCRHVGDAKGAEVAYRAVAERYAGAGQHQLALFYFTKCLGEARGARAPHPCQHGSGPPAGSALTPTCLSLLPFPHPPCSPRRDCAGGGRR